MSRRSYRPLLNRTSAIRSIVLATTLAMTLAGCREGGSITIPGLINLSAITVDASTRVLERGTRDTLTATALNPDGDTVVVPVVWRSSNERVARFDRGGVLVALDTGITNITAAALGVQSQDAVFTVVWFGPATIDSGSFSPANARGPGVALTDSVRV